MTKGVRLTIFCVLAACIGVIYLNLASEIVSPNIRVLVFSAMLMLAFGSLLMEHYFTKPTDVLSTGISILFGISPLYTELAPQMGVWFWALFIYVSFLVLLSLASVILYSPDKSPSTRINKWSFHMKDFVVRFGSSKAQYFLLLISSMLFYVKTTSPLFLTLFFFACFVLLDPWKFILSLVASAKQQSEGFGLGRVAGVQAKNTFLVKSFDTGPVIAAFDPVEFRMKSGFEKQLLRGVVLDKYLLNSEQWLKVLVTPDITSELIRVPELQGKNDDVVYKLDGNAPRFLEKFIGVVTEQSTIGRAKFIYNSKRKISEGDLLEARISGCTVLYQIVQGTTRIETLSDLNEMGYVIGEAIQLGIWNEDKTRFEKFGWVPEVNTPLFCASDIPQPKLGLGEIVLGSIPGTNYPVIMNKELAVTHHLAVLGVTGTGKSVFSRWLIREYVKDGIKVICADFTGEYRKQLKDPAPSPVISEADSTDLFANIDWRQAELEKFANQQDKTKLAAAEKKIKEVMHKSIKEFLTTDDRKIALFELPDVVNTSGIFDYTRYFFKTLFEIAKNENSFGKKICVVLEEAHTIVPEWNFIGSGEKTSQSLVNSIGQIALQGRKYDIGFLVIAQRTANVSKTILTQCNSIIAFQEFDKTSSDFLSNYFGADIAAALPNLRFRQAVAVGKAFKSTTPMIFEVPEIRENEGAKVE